MNAAWRLALVITGLLASVSSVLHAGSLTSEVNGIRVELTSNPSGPRTKGETEYVARLVARQESRSRAPRSRFGAAWRTA